MKNRLMGLGIVWALLLASHAILAQVQHGTIVVVYYGEDMIAIAADSAALKAGRVTSECKLASIDGKLLFVTSGASLDNIIEARRAYSIAVAEGGDDLPLRTATIWHRVIAEKWQIRYRVRPQSVLEDVAIEHGGVTTAYFAGLGGTPRRLQLVMSRISFDPSAKQFNGTSAAASECLNTLCAMGKLDVAKEYILQTSDRAKQEWAQWDDQNGPFAGPQGKARVAMRLVDLTIANDHDDIKLGPPVDAATLAADGTVRWVARKDQCPAD